MTRRTLSLFVALLLSATVMAQAGYNRHEAARYNHMNSQGIWSLGLSLSPVVGISHPLSEGGRTTAAGYCGVGFEAGYFVLDNLRLYAEFGWASNSYENMFVDGGYDQLSALDTSLGAQWYMGRWAVGGGLLLGRTHYTVVPGITSEPTLPSYHDSRWGVGLDYNISYLLSPFFKVGAYYRPRLSGWRYAHTLGARVTIYLPFMDAVVCK